MLALSAGVAGALFAFDVLTPAQIASAVPYAGLVLVSLASRWPPYALVLAGLASILTLVGFYVSPGSESAWQNRAIALLAIWLAGALCYRQVQNTERLAEARSATEDQLRKTSSQAQRATHAYRSERDDRRRLEEERQIAEQRYRAVFNQAFQLVALLGPDGRVEEANETMLAAAGTTAPAVVGQPVWEIPLWPEPARERVRACVEEASRGNFCREEVEMTAAPGGTAVMDLSVKPIRQTNGQVDALILEARDISEHKRNQEMLLHAQKMDVLGQLTSGVAHDFNNLLMVIAGNIELVGRRMRDDPYLTERIEKAVNAAFHGKALTEQLLSFARKQDLAPRTVDLNELTVEAKEFLERTVQERIAIWTELAEGLWRCWVDPAQLQTALLNLLLNARDAMPAGGRATIKTANVTVGATQGGDGAAGLDLPPGDYVMLSVTDEGTGIPPALLDQVMDPFFTTKPAGTASGLGLSMAYGFTKQSGGDIRIASALGQGTTVALYLPRSGPAPADSRPPAAQEPAEPGKGRILMVEDDAEVRDIAATMLVELGYSVTYAADGEAAIAHLRSEEPFDLLLTDIMMPGAQTGPAVAETARTLRPEIRVLFSSGNAREGRALARAAGLSSGFIAKPYRYEDLARKVAAALARPV